MADLTTEEIWKILDEVKDPEIPVVSVVEMGLVRTIGVEDQDVIVTMTPTFSGCPALKVMEKEVEKRLLEAGAHRASVQWVYSPPWNSDWILPEARKKLSDFGLAPPPRHGGDIELALKAPAVCPFCGSENTTLKNSFGSTLCRSIYVCNQCHQPFEQFKPL
jgi:ring-1,2-phenylacetyl-CoA epoxidase subunit PaaD